MCKTDEKYMKLAIEDATQHLNDEGGGPFGACIVKNDRIIAVAHNTVLKDTDPTCHAEINAIRKAAKSLGCFDLSGCVIYSTTEPCPMCFSAIHWAKIDTIVFGSNIQDVQNLGFNELELPNQVMKQQGKSPVNIVEDFMRKECLDLLEQWAKQTSARTY